MFTFKTKVVIFFINVFLPLEYIENLMVNTKLADKKEIDKSKEFQQMIFDRLGDRDYDSFESDEHYYLKQKIGFAKFGPPSALNYDQKQEKNIEDTFQVIRKYSNMYSEYKDYIVVSFMYNCLEPLQEEKVERLKKYADYEAYTDIMPIPFFVIKKCTDSSNPCRIFIDHNNRVYSSWDNYKEHINLHKCRMVLPMTGRYYGNSNGEVQLVRLTSPSCNIAHSVLQGADIASSVAGTASGALLVAAAIPAITIAPIALTAAAITGAGVGAYAIIRSAFKLNDRVVHKQSMSFANSEARGAYLNIVAGSLGFVGAGVTGAVSKLASTGINIGQGAKATVNVLNVVNVGASAASIANTSYEMYDHWKEGGNITSLSIIQLTSSILFFGNAIYKFRSANTIIEEAQVNTLKKYQDSLQSNRQRKTFNKLLKETIRQDGNIQSGRAEVISTLSKCFDTKEVISTLTRNNKLFNKSGVRFAAKDGKITLNGVNIDINELGTMSPFEKTQYLNDLPSIPKASVENVKIVSNCFNTVFNVDNLAKVSKYVKVYLRNYSFMELATEMLQDFQPYIIEKILKIFDALLDKFDILNINVVDICKQYFPNTDILIVLKYIIQYIKGKNNESSQSLIILAAEKFVNFFLSGGCINRFLLKELLEYVLTKITKAIVSHCDNRQKMLRRESNVRSSRKVPCSTCSGFFYSL